MQLGPVTKVDRRNKTTSKNLMITSCWKIVTLLLFFEFTTNYYYYYYHHHHHYYYYIIIIIIIIIITIIIIIIINNFFFIGIIQHFKILQIAFKSKKIIKVNCKPSKTKALKDTFQQSFKLHNYWWELKRKEKKIFACTHKRTYAYASTHTHICTQLHNYIQTNVPTQRLTKIYFN